MGSLNLSCPNLVKLFIKGAICKHEITYNPNTRPNPVSKK